MAKRMFSRDVVGVFNSNVFSLICGLLLSVLLTRELGPEGFGLFSSLVVIPVIVVSITNLGIRGATIFLLGQKKYGEKEIISAIMALLVLSSLAGIIISFIAYQVYDDPGFTLLLISLVLAVIPFRLAVIYIGGIFIGKEEIKKANQLNWPINLVNLALAAVLVWGMKYDVTGAVIAGLIANIAVAVYSFIELRKCCRISVGFNFPIIKKLFGMGILYSASFFIIQLNYRIDIILLEKMKDLQEVGFYSLGVNIAEQLWQIPMAVSIVLFSRTANAENPSEMTSRTLRLARASLILAVLVSIGIVVIAPWIVPAVFGKEFLPSVILLQMVLPGIVMLVIFRVLSGQLSGMGKPQLSIYIFVPALILNIVLNLLLIPGYGGLGAAIATNISYLFGAIGYWIVFARFTGVGYLEIVKFQKDDLMIFGDVFLKLLPKWKK
jgi:O-antigen/teichoic acid export membrane protein